MELPPDTREHRHKIFIIDHPCCDVFFDLGMEHEIFDMDDAALFNPSPQDGGLNLSLRLSETISRLIASGRSTVLMPYQPDILRAMGELAGEIQKKFGDVWLFLAFFHSDHDTLSMNRPRRWTTEQEQQEGMDRKAEWILTLGEFPFVKMVELSVKETVTFQKLQELFTEYAPER
jgi:hypothetical protein